MEEEQITKKELLALTGISYGALYRWKRMGLLPEEWFIHRATPTGQETFFPREKVLGRVAEIQRLKERMRLEEIARHFSPEPAGDISLTPQEAAEAGVAPGPIVGQYLAAAPARRLNFGELMKLYIFSELLQQGRVSRDEALDMAEAAGAAGDISEPVVYLLRKYGVAFCVTAGEMQPLEFDRNAVLAAQVRVDAQRAALTELLRSKGIDI